MASYSVTFSVLDEAAGSLRTSGRALSECAETLKTVREGLRTSKTLVDLGYDELVAKLQKRAIVLGEDTTDAGGILDEVHARVNQAESRTSQAVSSAGSSTTAQATVVTPAPDTSAQAVAAEVTAAAGVAGASEGSFAAGATDTPADGNAADAEGMQGATMAGSTGAAAGVEAAITAEGDALTADGLGPGSGSGSHEAVQKLMDEITGSGEGGGASPAGALSDTMRNQMEDFGSRWSDFEQAAAASQDASALTPLNVGKAAYSQASDGLSSLVDAGLGGLASFGAGAADLASRYGLHALVAAGTVTFLATKVNGTLSFTPTAISHAFRLGMSSLATKGCASVGTGMLMRG